MLTADRFVRSGKVRDLYDLPDGRLLMVASDRISAFDVVLPTQIPDKGRVLTGLSRFWFAQTSAIVPNHLRSVAVDDPEMNAAMAEARPQHRPEPVGRYQRDAVLVDRARPAAACHADAVRMHHEVVDPGAEPQ